MNVFKVEIMIVDHDKIGEQGIRDALEHSHYPNDCIRPEVKKVESRDIGEWYDQHPLNLLDQADAEYGRLFGS